MLFIFAIRVNSFFYFQDFRVQRLIARINLNLQLTFLKCNSENAMVGLLIQVFICFSKFKQHEKRNFTAKWAWKCFGSLKWNAPMAFEFFSFFLYIKTEAVLRVAQSWNDFIAWKKRFFFIFTKNTQQMKKGMSQNSNLSAWISRDSEYAPKSSQTADCDPQLWIVRFDQTNLSQCFNPHVSTKIHMVFQTSRASMFCPVVAFTRRCS